MEEVSHYQKIHPQHYVEGPPQHSVAIGSGFVALSKSVGLKPPPDRAIAMNITRQDSRNVAPQVSKLLSSNLI